MSGRTHWLACAGAGLLAAGLQAAPDDFCRAAELPARAIELTNRLRAQGATCGGVTFAPAPPLQWSPAATTVALRHAQDMALQRRLKHAGSDGSHGGERLRHGGVDWQRWAENLAAGQRSLDQVLAQWLQSAAHCENLMDAELQHMGLACAADKGGRLYWAMSFATLR